MIRIGIDTSVLIGLLDPKDVWHEPATALKQVLIAHEADIALFDCVLAEAHQYNGPTYPRTTPDI